MSNPVTPGSPEARRRKVLALAREIGLTVDDRMELASALLWRDVVSWADLTDEQVSRLLDALEGYGKVRWLLENQAP